MSQKRSKNKFNVEIIVALIGLLGTTVVAIFGYMNTRAEVVLPINATQTFEARQTLTAYNITSTPTLQVAQVTTSTATNTNASTTTPQIVSFLPQAQKTIVQKAAEALIQAAQALPLIVKDTFDSNDYGWPIENNIYTGGIECNTAIIDGKFVINIHTADGPAFCINGITKVAKDFIVSVDQQVINKRNSDIYVYYRFSADGKNFYDIAYNPQTQIFSAGVTKDGQYYPIISSVYVEEINIDGINKITVLALGNSHVVYINDKLIAMFTDDRVSEGQIRITIQLQEANQEESLLIDNFDLRGN